MFCAHFLAYTVLLVFVLSIKQETGRIFIDQYQRFDHFLNVILIRSVKQLLRIAKMSLNRKAAGRVFIGSVLTAWDSSKYLHINRGSRLQSKPRLPQLLPTILHHVNMNIKLCKHVIYLDKFNR